MKLLSTFVGPPLDPAGDFLGIAVVELTEDELQDLRISIESQIEGGCSVSLARERLKQMDVLNEALRQVRGRRREAEKTRL